MIVLTSNSSNVNTSNYDSFSVPFSSTSTSSSHPQNSGSRDLSIFYQNVRGLRTKLDLCRTTLTLKDYDLYAFTETNLTSSHFSDEIGFRKEISVHRCDRNLANTSKRSHGVVRNKRGGGGVLLAVRDDAVFSSDKISSSSQHFEQLFIRVTVVTKDSGKKFFIIGVIYLPPDSPSQLYTSHFEEVERLRTLYPNDTYLLLGDYNLPELSWSMDTPPVCSEPRGYTLLDSVSFLDFKQVNFLRNSMGRTLDLVLTSSSHECSIEVCDSFLPIDDHHPPMCVSLSLPPAEVPIDESIVYNFKKAPYSLINNLFSGFDWPSYLDSSNIEENVKRDSFPTWYSPYLKYLIIQKKNFHKLFKSSRDPYYYQSFSILRSQCKVLAGNCYSSYLSSVVQNIKQNPRYFWKYSKNLKGGSTLPTVLKYGDIESSSLSSSANLFAKHFSSVFVDVPLCSPDLQFVQFQPVSSCSISPSDVLKKLNHLNVYKGAGPDGIPPIFLRNCSKSLASPLWFLFNESLNSGCFPSLWKSSYVTPEKRHFQECY